eukprot:c1639_g1_i1.p1 GENE.c1639_g1_i1~~c1639_g1_i1.p1  ORF type:complete len:160 (+),score=27.55 c1639_g1_i1:25-480(+)
MAMAEVCAACKAEFFPGQTKFRVGEQQYHVPCFKCARCKAIMMDYSEINGVAHCTKCTTALEEEAAAVNAAEYDALDAGDEADYFASLPKCAKCTLPIEEQYLTALDATWHPACFVCSNESCPHGRPPLSGSFKVAAGRGYCCAECKPAAS